MHLCFLSDSSTTQITPYSHPLSLPDALPISTAIDRRAQRFPIAARRRQLSGLGSERVLDGAVVVLDNRTGDVLAYVGGVGLNSTAAAVDGANAPRQAGSTLKPHLYAQVIEIGRAHV